MDTEAEWRDTSVPPEIDLYVYVCKLLQLFFYRYEQAQL